MKLVYRGIKSRVVMIKQPTYYYALLNLGQEFEVEDQVGYALLTKYPDLLRQAPARDKSIAASPRDKMVHSVETK